MYSPFRSAEFESRLDRYVPTWVPLGLRAVVIGLVARPAASKFLSYANSVEFFTRLGVPNPELSVLASGTVEVAAVALLVFGVQQRLAAVSLIPVMVVAVAYAGPTATNLGVLLGCVGLLAIGGDDSGFLFTESTADD